MSVNHYSKFIEENCNIYWDMCIESDPVFLNFLLSHVVNSVRIKTWAKGAAVQELLERLVTDVGLRYEI